jgi:hypothetical protein
VNSENEEVDQSVSIHAPARAIHKGFGGNDTLAQRLSARSHHGATDLVQQAPGQSGSSDASAHRRDAALIGVNWEPSFAIRCVIDSRLAFLLEAPT